MFDNKYICENIDIIFEREKHNLTQFKPFCYVADIKKGLENFDLSIEDKYHLEWETYDTLKQLFNKIEISADNRNTFIDCVKDEMLDFQYREWLNYDDQKEFHDVSSLAFYFLMKVGQKDDIIEIIQKIYSITNMTGLSYDLSLFMHLEPSHFDMSILNALDEALSRNFVANELNGKIKSEINLIKYRNLQNELVGINEEINIDREKVIGLISKYGFPREMEDVLLEIEQLSEFAEWKTFNSGMIGNLRTFHDKLIENIAEKINSETGIDYPNKAKTPRENYRLYIKDILKLTGNDNKLIKSFTDILNQEGSHAFLSEKKYFNLTKNIGIEISLFLFSKLDDFMEKKSIKRGL